MKPINVKLSKSPQTSFKYKKIALESLEFNWHYHPEYEIMFMEKCKGKRFIGDSISYFKEGDLFLIGSNLPHTWYSPPETKSKKRMRKAILIQFMENFTGLNVSQIPELYSIHNLFSNASRGIQFFGETRRCVAKKILEMENLQGLDRFILLIQILDILGKAEKSQSEVLSSIEFTHRLRPGQQSRIDRVCSFINKNYKEPLRLEDGASIINMSTTAFSRFFKKSTGKTFINYVNELRIGWACKLLIESEMTIAEICYEIGFNNLSNFNRRFSDRHKISPREYRRQFASNF